MKIITLDGLKTFLDELLEKIGQEVYSKVESDKKYATKDTEAKLQGVRFKNASHPGRPLPIVMQVDSPLGVTISGGPLQGYVSDSDARETYQPKASLMQDVIDELESDDFEYWKDILDFDPTEGVTKKNATNSISPKATTRRKPILRSWAAACRGERGSHRSARVRGRFPAGLKSSKSRGHLKQLFSR